MWSSRRPCQRDVTFLLDPREQAVAQWVFDHGRLAGKTTDTLPAAKGLYLPLRTSRGVVSDSAPGPPAFSLSVLAERSYD